LQNKTKQKTGNHIFFLNVVPQFFWRRMAQMTFEEVPKYEDYVVLAKTETISGQVLLQTLQARWDAEDAVVRAETEAKINHARAEREAAIAAADHAFQERTAQCYEDERRVLESVNRWRAVQIDAFTMKPPAEQTTVATAPSFVLFAALWDFITTHL
jgi:hypothetical protein